MNKPLAPGMQVIVVHTHDPRYYQLVGMSGVIERQLTVMEMLLSGGSEWDVSLPDSKDIPCPCCGKHHHDCNWMFASSELKPFEDPDQGLDTERVEDAPIDLEVAALELSSTIGEW